MNNSSQVIRITVMLLCVIAVFSYGIYSVFFKARPKEASINYENAFSPFGFESEKSEISASDTVSPVDAPADETARILPAGAGEVLGKIANKTAKCDNSTVCGSVHIKNSTGLDINADELLSSGLGFKIEENGDAQVLIVHTHATESFLSESRDYYTATDYSRTTDNSANVTALGNIIAEKLNAASIVTVHDSTQHDYPSYNGSYQRAAVTIKSQIKKHPGIKVVIDLHRDAIQSGSTKTKLTAEIGGRRAAQIMLVMGSQSGNVKNFPNWKENLKLALRLQKNAEIMYPELARPLSLVSRTYNESITTGSLLIEIGTDANSFAEAEYSAELLAEALIKTLKEG